MARINGEYKINPNFSEMEQADLELMVAATEENIMMVEGEMNEVTEDVMLGAIKFAHEEIKRQCRVQVELNAECGKQVKRDYPHDEEDEDLRKAVHEFCYDKCYALAKSAKPKQERTEGFEQIKADFLATLSEEEQEAKAAMVSRYYAHEEKEAMRNMILDEGTRLDGRSTTEVRPIWCEVDCLPCAHGSAIFTRGETQSLASVTLGTKMDMKEMDEVLIRETQQFVLHYNFPPFSTGEARPQKGVGRREVGHGNLAFRALKAVMPKAPEFPYAVRVVSDILESNGSSSQASICGGCLALMDAGVPIKKPVAGVAMGLITDAERPNDRYAILTDILGDEDHLGDMDFKVAGTKDGITATQMDIKVDGLSYEVLEKALEQARQGRLHIMGEMMKTHARTTSRSYLESSSSRFLRSSSELSSARVARPSRRYRLRPAPAYPSTRLTARVSWTSPPTTLKQWQRHMTGSWAYAQCLRRVRFTTERLFPSSSSVPSSRYFPARRDSSMCQKSHGPRQRMSRTCSR